MDPRAVTKHSPLVAGSGVFELPRFFAERYAPPAPGDPGAQVRQSLDRLNETGYWPAPLPQNSHPYRGDASPGQANGDYATTHVGDAFDTSPFNDGRTPSISTAEYLRNMNLLIRWLTQRQTG